MNIEFLSEDLFLLNTQFIGNEVKRTEEPCT